MSEARNWIVDHNGLGVADIHRSAKFYQAALRALGVKVVACLTREMKPAKLEDAELGGVAFGVDFPVFWIDVRHPAGVKQHVAFRAGSRAQVDAFHQAGLEAGGTDHGAPGLRTEGYPPGYYAAFLLDPEGNNIEAVFRGAAD